MRFMPHIAAATLLALFAGTSVDAAGAEPPTDAEAPASEPAVPKSSAPDAAARDATAPDVSAPDREAPDREAPDAKAPEQSAPSDEFWAERARLEAEIAADANWDLPRLSLAEALVGSGRELGLAETLLDDAERIRPDNPRLHRIRGELLELKQDDAGAAEAYGRSLGLRSDIDLRLRRGMVLARLERDSEAIEELQRVRVERPRNAAARGNLADLFEKAGKTREAEVELLALANLSPEQAAPLVRLARFYSRHGQPEKSRVTELRARGLEGTSRRLRQLR